MAILKVENLTLAYDNKSVVRNCNFQLHQGEVLVVLGASGEGKSSLLKAISGHMSVKKGKIEFEGKVLPDAADMLIPGHDEIRLVNQDFALDTYHTVEENIRLKILAFDKEYQEERTAHLLRLVKLTSFKSRQTTQLSGGQKQRLAIARALADEPSVILLDEPFNQLDFQTKERISQHVKRYIKKNNISAIIVTHNGLEAMEWADRIVYMEKGKIKRIATPKEFFLNPSSENEAAFFGEINKLAIEGQKFYFRPSFFSIEKTDFCSKKIKVKHLDSQFLGWYSSHIFQCLGQKIKLFSSEDISELNEVFIHPIHFND